MEGKGEEADGTEEKPLWLQTFSIRQQHEKKEGGEGEKEQGSINEIILTCTWF